MDDVRVRVASARARSTGTSRASASSTSRSRSTARAAARGDSRPRSSSSGLGGAEDRADRPPHARVLGPPRLSRADPPKRAQARRRRPRVAHDSRRAGAVGRADDARARSPRGDAPVDPRIATEMLFGMMRAREPPRTRADAFEPLVQSVDRVFMRGVATAGRAADRLRRGCRRREARVLLLIGLAILLAAAVASSASGRRSPSASSWRSRSSRRPRGRRVDHRRARARLAEREPHTCRR